MELLKYLMKIKIAQFLPNLKNHNCSIVDIQYSKITLNLSQAIFVIFAWTLLVKLHNNLFSQTFVSQKHLFKRGEEAFFLHIDLKCLPKKKWEVIWSTAKLILLLLVCSKNRSKNIDILKIKIYWSDYIYQIISH